MRHAWLLLLVACAATPPASNQAPTAATSNSATAAPQPPAETTTPPVADSAALHGATSTGTAVPDDTALTFHTAAPPGNAYLYLPSRLPPVSLSSRLVVEREEGGKFVPAPVQNLYLVERCGGGGPVPTCVTIKEKCDAQMTNGCSGATFKIEPWSGMSCSSQCAAACDKNVYLGAGTYRFVATTCDGSKRIESPPFTMPAR